MLCAGAANQGQLFGNRLPCPVQTYGCIVWRYASRPGKVFNRLLTEIDFFDGSPVFVFEIADDIPNAGTNRLLELRFVAGRSFRRESFVRFIPRGSPPVMIGDRIAEGAIEPRNGAFAVPDRRAMFNGPDIGRLQNVFGRCRILNARCKEVEKPCLMRCNSLQNIFPHGSTTALLNSFLVRLLCYIGNGLSHFPLRVYRMRKNPTTNHRWALCDWGKNSDADRRSPASAFRMYSAFVCRRRCRIVPRDGTVAVLVSCVSLYAGFRGVLFHPHSR